MSPKLRTSLWEPGGEGTVGSPMFVLPPFVVALSITVLGRVKSHVALVVGDRQSTFEGEIR